MAGATTAKPSSSGHTGGPNASHDTARLVQAWVAVGLMVVGFILATLALPIREARIPLFISGGVIMLAGFVLALAGRIMENVEY